MAQLDRSSRIGIIGAGTVGRALAIALSREGYPVVASSSRRFSSAEAMAAPVAQCVAYGSATEVADATDFVLITSTDDAIGPIAASISWRRGQGVAHCSGAASLDVLEPARRQGAIPGGFHPLQTFSTVEAALKALPGSTFGIEGAGEMRSYLNDMAFALGGNPIFLRSEDKPLYHASVVMVGGLLTELAGAVAQLWRNFGIERAEALQALLPIMEGGVATLQAVGVPGALAGPYVRGDLGTVQKHLDAIGARAPEALPTYCQMALFGLPLALEKGNVTEQRIAEIRGLLRDALARQTTG